MRTKTRNKVNGKAKNAVPNQSKKTFRTIKSGDAAYVVIDGQILKGTFARSFRRVSPTEDIYLSKVSLRDGSNLIIRIDSDMLNSRQLNNYVYVYKCDAAYNLKISYMNKCKTERLQLEHITKKIAGMKESDHPSKEYALRMYEENRKYLMGRISSVMEAYRIQIANLK